jgi:hypothetical protein
MKRFFIRHGNYPAVAEDIGEEAMVADLIRTIQGDSIHLRQLGITTALPLTLHLPDGTLLKPHVILTELRGAGTDGEHPLVIKQKGVSIH